MPTIYFSLVETPPPPFSGLRGGALLHAAGAHPPDVYKLNADVVDDAAATARPDRLLPGHTAAVKGEAIPRALIYVSGR